MTSFQWNEKPLLERGFHYLVIQNIGHLKTGQQVRVMNSQYHQAPQDAGGGYIIEFPDMSDVRLDRDFDKKIIEHIDHYLRKLELFDWEKAIQELKINRQTAASEFDYEQKRQLNKKNKKAENMVRELVKRGMTPKEAYEYLIKKRKL